MRNPWVHDDVPDSADATYRSRAKLFAAVLWGVLAVVVAVVLFSGDGLADIGRIETMGSAITFAAGALAMVFALPIVFKLLAFSRALAAIAFLGTLWLVGRFLLRREAERLGAAADGVAGGMEPIAELLEILDVIAVLL